MNDTQQALLRQIGMAYRANCLEIGEDPVQSAVENRRARLLFLAEDVTDNTRRRGKQFEERCKATLVLLPVSKAQLGACLGRSSCGIIAVTESGFAAAMMEKLVAIEGDIHKALAEELAEKAAKMQRRKKEKRQATKQKQSPWACPPKEASHGVAYKKKTSTKP